jgi:sirohydrochlorin cobaltochelatase
MADAKPMSSAPFRWQADGRPDWGGMWTTFCDLALHGGPPQRGAASALRAPTGANADSERAMLAEMRRGIWETTGLYAESAEPGWLTVTCDSPAMAEWMGAAIVLENVEARVEEDRLRLPAGPGYRLEDEVKSIITVVAKTHHYWQAHRTGGGHAADAVGRG